MHVCIQLHANANNLTFTVTWQQEYGFAGFGHLLTFAPFICPIVALFVAPLQRDFAVEFHYDPVGGRVCVRGHTHAHTHTHFHTHIHTTHCHCQVNINEDADQIVDQICCCNVYFRRTDCCFRKFKCCKKQQIWALNSH